MRYKESPTDVTEHKTGFSVVKRGDSEVRDPTWLSES